MTRTWPRLPLLLSLLTSLGACAADQRAPDEGQIRTTGAERPTFEAWARDNARQLGDEYLVEGDMLLSRAQAEAYYAAHVSRSGALFSYTGAYDGISKFVEHEQQNITWCIDLTEFSSTEVDRLSSFAYQAMGAWEAAANVRFRYLTPLGGCEASGALIRMRALDESAGGAAAANPPGASANGADGGRRLWIKKSVVNGGSAFLMAVMQHELGHSLGFGHEHDRASDSTKCEDMVDGYLVDGDQSCGAFQSPRDTSSVMFYVNLAGYTGGAGGNGWNYITQWDLEGAQKVYGAPTNLVSTESGVVHVRKLSTGDFYRRESNGTWTKIADPARAFVSVGNTLFLSASADGTAKRYTGGQSWGTISGDNGQVFRCATSLCATNPTTQQIARYNGGSSWTYIGGAGLRFAGTETQIFGIRPHQEAVALWSGSGASWSYAGAASYSRELAGGGTSMVRILTGYASTFDTAATIERFNGSSWTAIGSFSNLRQVHATGPNIYALDGANSVYHYFGIYGWLQIDDAPSVSINRLYGSYGRLYGMTVNGTVYAYQSGAWTSLGKP